MLAIVVTVLIVSGCSSSRKTTRWDERMRMVLTAQRDSMSEERVVVAVHDTIMEVTTITVRENDHGDTLQVTQVTDRTRARALTDVRSRKEDVEMISDALFVDSYAHVEEKAHGAEEKMRGSPVESKLKWGFWMIIALTVLVIIRKMSKFF